MFEHMEIVTEQISKLIYSYYESLKKEGFSEEQAFFLEAQFAQMHWDRIINGVE